MAELSPGGCLRESERAELERLRAEAREKDKRIRERHARPAAPDGDGSGPMAAWMTTPFVFAGGGVSVQSHMSRTGKLLSTAAAAALSATLFPVVAAPPAAAVTCDAAAANRAPTAGTITQARAAVMCLINAQRTQRGLPSLTISQALTNASQQHGVAAVQLKWWGPGKDPHRNPRTGSTPQSRIQAAGYCPNPRSWEFNEITYTGWGGSGTPQAAVNWWMNSPAHRAVILKPSLREIGPWAQPGSADRAGASSPSAGTYVVTFGRCQR
ncbi:CAP domain-containing protein [Streptomyces mirabilis]|uniref:CAP domain-containing protein n=1 Tax=Streptomyces mirabilis TaxID=68239 RepID=UPI0037F8E024